MDNEIRNYRLVIARLENGQWIIDEDSEYILEEVNRDQAVCLTVSKIEAIGGD